MKRMWLKRTVESCVSCLGASLGQRDYLSVVAWSWLGSSFSDDLAIFYNYRTYCRPWGYATFRVFGKL